MRLCKVGDRTVTQVAVDLDLTELTQLRRENKRLQMEREILEEAAAFFAKENT